MGCLKVCTVLLTSSLKQILCSFYKQILKCSKTKETNYFQKPFQKPQNNDVKEKAIGLQENQVSLHPLYVLKQSLHSLNFLTRAAPSSRQLQDKLKYS